MVEVTIEQIKRDLETAAYVERLLPSVRSPKYRNCMPEIVYTPQELIFMDKKPLKILPTQEQIDLWEHIVLDWLSILEVAEKQLVWKRANKIPWKFLCRDFGLCRARLMIKYDKALIKIEFYLKGTQKCTRQKRSRHFCKKSL